MKRIQPVSIEFKDSGTPYSPIFQDFYYAPGTGIEESIHVYLDGSGFTRDLELNKKKGMFNVGEIGFGVGLNFLLTYRHFLENSQPSQKLTYISVDLHPVKIEGLKKLYTQFPELAVYSNELLEQYPVLTPGVHTLSFAGGRIKLILMLGDAQKMFSNLNLTPGQKIEFWYWDGFAPNKNPDVFQDSLFKELIQISMPTAKAASFTTAGWVRRGLEGVGFRVEKTPGFGNKRECLRVHFPESAFTKTSKKPWFSTEKIKSLKPGDRIAVVGAGLSGTAIARALANRGYPITLIEQESIAAQASGNPVGLYNFQMSRIPNPISRFSQLSLVHFLRELKTSSLSTQKGILRLDAAKNKNDFEQALVTSEYPGEFYEFREDGVYFPECGMLSPRKLCEERSNHPNIELKISKVVSIDRNKNGFTLIDINGTTITECEHVVYATGAALALDKQINHELLKKLPIKPIRGQIIQVSPTAESIKIPHILQDSIYITPIAPEISGTDTHCIGATYQAKNILPNQVNLDSNHLMEKAKEKHQAFKSLCKENFVSSRVGYRLSTPDKLPLIGPLCNPDRLKEMYSKALLAGSHRDLAPLESESGEWLFLGMSSRGITFSSYGAEILASLMCGETLPIEADLWEHLHSARFIVRNLKRG